MFVDAIPNFKINHNSKVMKKILTITLDSDRGSIVTEWGDGVTANDVIAMCEYAEGEAQYELDLADIDDEDLE